MEVSKDGHFDEIPTLSFRQKQILCLRSNGLSNKQISVSLNISEHTVKEHISIVLKKLEVKSVTQAIAYLLRNNCLD